MKGSFHFISFFICEMITLSLCNYWDSAQNCYLFWCCFNQILLVWFRGLHGCNCSFRRPWCSTQLCMHWYTLCLLHGCQRCRLSTLRWDREHESSANVILPLLILTHCHHIHSHVALCNSREGQNCLTQRHCHHCHCYLPNFPLRGTSSTEARVMGRPLDAMDTLCINLPKHILARVSRWHILHTICVLFDPHRAHIHTIQRPFKLRCRRSWLPMCKEQGESRIRQQLQSIENVEEVS